LQITEEASEQNTGYIDEISTVPANENNVQAGLPNNMIPDPGWFNRARTKFENWWREMKLFLKSN